MRQELAFLDHLLRLVDPAAPGDAGAYTAGGIRRRTPPAAATPATAPSTCRPSHHDDSTFFGLQTSLRGLLAQQQAIDITGHNIANANTAGYSRQEAVLEPTRPYVDPGEQRRQRRRRAARHAASTSAAIRRIRDQFLDLQYRAQQMSLGDATAPHDVARPGRAGVRRAGRRRHRRRSWRVLGRLERRRERARERRRARRARDDRADARRRRSERSPPSSTTVAQQAQDEYDAITGPERRRREHAPASWPGSTERSATPSSAGSSRTT